MDINIRKIIVDAPIHLYNGYNTMIFGHALHTITFGHALHTMTFGHALRAFAALT